MHQQARFASSFGGEVVGAYPLTHTVTDVPAGVVPDDNDDTLAFLSGNLQEANNENPHLFAHGLSRTEIQIDLLCILSASTETGQGFFRRMAWWRSLNQS
jgi:hypothetical protein